MKKILIIFGILTLLLSINSFSQITYKIGDTLSVRSSTGLFKRPSGFGYAQRDLHANDLIILVDKSHAKYYKIVFIDTDQEYYILKKASLRRLSEKEKKAFKDPNYTIIKNSSDIIEEYSPNILRVFSSLQLIYYGIDLSMMKLTNVEKIGQDEDLRKYFLGWLSYLEDEIPPDEHIQRWLNLDGNFIYNPSDVQKRIELIPEKWIAFENNNLDLEALKEVIKSYNLKAVNGLGFVVNIENFNKRNEYVSAYFTFFDIASKDILWTTKVKGNPGGIGMTSYWAGGIVNAFKLYIDKNYKQKYKTYK